jgi:hypothetical protein
LGPCGFSDVRGMSRLFQSYEQCIMDLSRSGNPSFQGESRGSIMTALRYLDVGH